MPGEFGEVIALSSYAQTHLSSTLLHDVLRNMVLIWMLFRPCPCEQGLEFMVDEEP